MMRRLSRTESRGLALALVGVTIIVVYLAVIRPIAGIYGSSQDRIAALNDRLLRYRSVISTEDTINERLAALGDDADLAASFLEQETLALASADLQQYITQTVAAAGGQLISTQVLPTDDNSELVEATVKVGMRGNSEILHALLYMFEGRRPIVSLDNLQLIGRGRAGAVTSSGDALNISFDLTGYLKAEAG